jgi:hypothetical protein
MLDPSGVFYLTGSGYSTAAAASPDLSGFYRRWARFPLE